MSSRGGATKRQASSDPTGRPSLKPKSICCVAGAGAAGVRSVRVGLGFVGSSIVAGPADVVAGEPADFAGADRLAMWPIRALAIALASRALGALIASINSAAPSRPRRATSFGTSAPAATCAQALRPALTAVTASRAWWPNSFEKTSRHSFWNSRR